MAEKGLIRRLSRVPLLGGVVTLLGIARDVYDTIGWTDPGYHRIRSSEERLEEARRVGAIGNAEESEGEHARDGESESGRE